MGRVSHVSLQPEGQPPVSATAVNGGGKTYIDADGTRKAVSDPRALLESEIPAVVEEFRLAAARCMEAGFDGVEIHGANGYLLEQFYVQASTIEPMGTADHSKENEILPEVAEAVVSEVGSDRTGYRISPIGGEADGQRHDHNMLETYGTLADRLAEMKIAFIDVVESFSVGVREEGLDRICARIREAFDGKERGLYVAGGGYTRETARKPSILENAMRSFWPRFHLNPDLRRRLREDLPLTPGSKVVLSWRAEGLTDWPLAEEKEEKR